MRTLLVAILPLRRSTLTRASLAAIRKPQFCRKETDSLCALIGGNILVWNAGDATRLYSLWNVYQSTLMGAKCFRAEVFPSKAIRSDRFVSSLLQFSPVNRLECA